MGRRSNPAPRIPMTDLSPDLPSSAARAGLLLRQIAGVAVSLAFTFLGLLLVTFIIARVVPIDPVLSILGDRATDAQIAAERLRLGLDEPMWKQFGIYIWQAVQGDLGTSIRTGSRRRSWTRPPGASSKMRETSMPSTAREWRPCSAGGSTGAAERSGQLFERGVFPSFWTSDSKTL